MLAVTNSFDFGYTNSAANLNRNNLGQERKLVGAIETFSSPIFPIWQTARFSYSLASPHFGEDSKSELRLGAAKRLRYVRLHCSLEDGRRGGEGFPVWRSPLASHDS